MCEADLSSADQVVIFKGDFACLQAINLTTSTTGDLVFMGGTKFLPVGVSCQQNVVRWNSLSYSQYSRNIVLFVLCFCNKIHLEKYPDPCTYVLEGGIQILEHQKPSLKLSFNSNLKKRSFHVHHKNILLLLNSFPDCSNE